MYEGNVGSKTNAARRCGDGRRLGLNEYSQIPVYSSPSVCVAVRNVSYGMTFSGSCALTSTDCQSIVSCFDKKLNFFVPTR